MKFLEPWKGRKLKKLKWNVFCSTPCKCVRSNPIICWPIVVLLQEALHLGYTSTQLSYSCPRVFLYTLQQ